MLRRDIEGTTVAVWEHPATLVSLLQPNMASYRHREDGLMGVGYYLAEEGIVFGGWEGQSALEHVLSSAEICCLCRS